MTSCSSANMSVNLPKPASSIAAAWTDVAEGMTNREIASRLQLSEHTIKNYLFRVFEKLGVSNRAELVSFALNHRPALQERSNGR